MFNMHACSRVHKTDAELAVMRYVNRVSSEAHVRVMRAMRPGLFEYQAERYAREDSVQ